MTSKVSVPATATQVQKIRWMRTYNYYFTMLARGINLAQPTSAQVGAMTRAIDEQARMLANAYYETVRELFHGADNVPAEALPEEVK